MRRLAIPAGVVMALLVGAGTALAAGAPTVEVFPATFTLSSDACSNLPDGTVITGSGTARSITRIRTDGAGVTTISNTTHTVGVATDQDGNSYVFNYSNVFRVSDTAASPGQFSGLMTDSFSLSGPGPATLHNGFAAVFTTDFDTSFGFDALTSRGDPIDFATGAARCDPL